MGVMQGRQTAWRTCQAPEVILRQAWDLSTLSQRLGCEGPLPSDSEQEVSSRMTPAPFPECRIPPELPKAPRLLRMENL